MSQKRKLTNIRINGQPTTWRAMSGIYNVDYRSIYNKAQKSNKTAMAINGDVIQWDVATYESYFVVEGKRLETIRELAAYLKIGKSTVDKILHSSGKSFMHNNVNVKRFTKLKSTQTETGVIDAIPFEKEVVLFKYDVIEFGGHQLVRKLYIGGCDEVLSHTYGYEQGKQFLTL
jgi:hypothetical protein